MGLLEGKTVLVTGSRRGIGAAIAVCFAREGAKVIINYLQNEGAGETLARIQNSGGKGFVVRADVRVDEEARFLINETVRVFGGLDILVNNRHLSQIILVKKYT